MTYIESETAVQKDDSPDLISAGLNSTLSRSYTIKSATDGAALLLLKTAHVTAPTVDGIVLTAPPVFTLKRVTNGVYDGKIDYKHPGRDEQTEDELLGDNDEIVSFNFSGGSTSFTHAISQTKHGTNARNVGLAINVQSDGVVEGVDIGDLSDTFSVAVILPSATVTNAWLRLRYAQRKTINDNTFRGLNEGECLLSGLSGNKQSDGRWRITYDFAIALEETVTDIGGVATAAPLLVEGWQYAWVMYETATDAAGDDGLVPVPIGAYVADLFPKTSFADLGVTV